MFMYTVKFNRWFFTSIILSMLIGYVGDGLSKGKSLTESFQSILIKNN